MITTVLILVVLGVALELVKTKLPIDSTIKVVIQAVIVLFAIVTLLRLFGIVDVPLTGICR